MAYYEVNQAHIMRNAYESYMRGLSAAEREVWSDEAQAAGTATGRMNGNKFRPSFRGCGESDTPITHNYD